MGEPPGRAEYGYDVGVEGSVEELALLESRQDRRNSTPATRKGKPTAMSRQRIALFRGQFPIIR